ncbi:MAG: hypothetical protein HYT40_01115 [Candidatus Sungbacteria bacterium]|uniref:SCP domain-containing protein n=1 Tax=Candidatus Sungiibacteriota bacterium TaxID=2750080 RepID=A0A931SB40_9BACT|nr:hypothetical protein [Candidatus Sungbacteria bacterium]
MQRVLMFMKVLGIGLVVIGLLFFIGAEFLPADFFERLPEAEQRAIDAVEEVRREVLSPPPLRAVKEAPTSSLTRAGVLQWTNIERKSQGLLPLSGNAKLDAAAAAKVSDMFARQYFEHVSPAGVAAGDLAKEAGYEYIAIGENLALGNFENDRALVEAWMASPGHRANIMKASYQEIGVGVARGVFEGNRTWLAVQIFGRPRSACPDLDQALKASIEANEAELDLMQGTLAAERKEIEAMRGRSNPAYPSKIEAYNALIAEYNALVLETKNLVGDYNAGVQVFNRCVEGDITP